MQYFIMNKDRVVVDFDIISYMILSYSQLPYGCTVDTLYNWIMSRIKIRCVRNVEEFFVSLDLKTVADIIDVFHCVSLQDTFWVKRGSDSLNWRDVSPFRNNYTDLISHYALEGRLIGLRQSNTKYFSPVVGTDGTFPHTWKYVDSTNIIFIKAGTKYTLGGRNSGMEPFSEYFASKLCDYLGFNHVTYTIRRHIRQDKRVDTVTECKCFTTEKHGSVSAASLGLSSYEEIINFSRNPGVDSYNTVLDMLFLDCLLLNTDRHFGNIEFIMDTDSLNILKVVPIFDNNFSLLPRFIEYLDRFDRSDYIARDNRSFEDLYRLVSSNKNYNSLLIWLKKFKFVKPDSVDISDERINFLNEFLQIQVDYLLSL